MNYPHVTPILLGLAVAVAVLASLGMLLVSDALQKLHFPGVIVSISFPLVAAAVWLEDPQAQPRVKVTLIVLILLWMNAVLTHATARAMRIRRVHHLAVERSENIPPPAESAAATGKTRP